MAKDTLSYTSAREPYTVEVDGKAQQEFRSFAERAAYIKKNYKQFGDKAPKNKQVTKNGEALTGFSKDIVLDLKEAKQEVNHLRKGSKTRAAFDISFGQYAQERWGIATDEFGTSDNLLKLIGVNKYENTLADLAGKGLSFSNIAEQNEGYSWLVGEVILDALRISMTQRAIWRELISASEMVTYDRITIPIIKNASAGFERKREGSTMKIRTQEFGEIDMKVETVADAFSITDELARNSRINVLQEWLMNSTGKHLNTQLTWEAVDRLLNGNTNGGADAAPIIGVGTPGAFDYDNDWLEVVVGAAELGYEFTKVLGVRAMIKEAMALDEFKGFDGMATKALTSMPGVPLPSAYQFYPTGAMPAKGVGGGKLLFLDNRFAMAHYSTKPLTIENERNILELTETTAVSMTSVFIKQMADASMVLDSSVNIAANPFPSEYDAETWSGNTGFN